MQMLRDLGQPEIDFVISSANGTFIDQAEQRALEQVIPDAIAYTAKPALGESVGASGLWQVILGAQGLRHGELPPVLHADLNDFVATFAFAHVRGRRAPRNRLKLWSQSASGSCAPGDPLVPNSPSLVPQRQDGVAKIALTERDELPTDFSICDFKPCHAWRCALVGSRHATGI